RVDSTLGALLHCLNLLTVRLDGSRAPVGVHGDLIELSPDGFDYIADVSLRGASTRQRRADRHYYYRCFHSSYDLPDLRNNPKFWRRRVRSVDLTTGLDWRAGTGISFILGCSYQSYRIAKVQPRARLSSRLQC